MQLKRLRKSSLIITSSFIEERKPIWIALSEFYLDTKLSENSFIYITKTFKDSTYSLEEIKQINKYEVYPIIYQNLLSMYSVWNGFDEKWLIESIVSRISNKSYFRRSILELTYYIFKGKKIIDWDKLTKIYVEIK
jgi:hypothetical protein